MTDPDTVPLALYEADIHAKDSEIAGLREELALSHAGLTDPSAIRAARAEYAAIQVKDGETKPPIGDVVAGWKKDAASAPITLRGILHPSSGGGGGGGGTGSLGGDDTGGNGEGAAVTADANLLMQKHRELMQNPGDEGLQKEVQQLRDAVRKSYLRRE